MGVSERKSFEVDGHRLEPFSDPGGRCVVGMWWVSDASGHVGILAAEPWREAEGLRAWLHERRLLEQAWHARPECYGEPRRWA